MSLIWNIFSHWYKTICTVPVLVRVSIANNMTESNLERKGFIPSYMSGSQSIMRGSQGRNARQEAGVRN